MRSDFWHHIVFIFWATACGGTLAHNEPSDDAGATSGGSTSGAAAFSSGTGGAGDFGGASGGVENAGYSNNGGYLGDGGHGGNSNNADASIGVGDSGTRPSWFCYGQDGREDACLAVEKSCCPGCGSSTADFVGVNASHVDQYRMEHCPNVPPCDAVACPGADSTNIMATCIAGGCTVIDIRQRSELSACTADSDCQLRAGLECCACEPSRWVAVSRSGTERLTYAACGAHPSCDPCVLSPPVGLAATCKNHLCTAVSVQ